MSSISLIPTNVPKLIRLFNRHVNNFHYLTTRCWFIRNISLQHKLLRIVNLRLGSKVDVLNGDFEIHLDQLIDEYLLHFSSLNLPIKDRYVLKLFSRYVNNFNYLETRGWFMTNYELQILLLKSVCFGLGDKIITISGDFQEHVENLLINFNSRVNYDIQF